MQQRENPQSVEMPDAATFQHSSIRFVSNASVQVAPRGWAGWLGCLADMVSQRPDLSGLDLRYKLQQPRLSRVSQTTITALVYSKITGCSQAFRDVAVDGRPSDDRLLFIMSCSVARDSVE